MTTTATPAIPLTMTFELTILILVDVAASSSKMCLVHASGLSAQVQNKIAGKRDPALEESIMQWMAAILGQPLPNGDFGDILRDGVVLCNLMNKLMPGCIPKINTSGGQFKLMENITHFQNAAKAWGVPEIDVFQTVDLWEKRNIPQVAQCLMAVGRACYMHPEYRGPVPRTQARRGAEARVDAGAAAGRRGHHQPAVRLQQGRHPERSELRQHPAHVKRSPELPRPARTLLDTRNNKRSRVILRLPPSCCPKSSTKKKIQSIRVKA
uniref:Putative calponin n=1 Tax=Rhipicephalus microplus TaxID=6941 RepID=A0A6G4ZUA3_RHIMP